MSTIVLNEHSKGAGGRRLTRSAMPSLSSITFNPVQTDMLLGLLDDLGTPAHSAIPGRGFDHPDPEVPRIGKAQITGNKLRSQAASGRGARHLIGFQENPVLALDLDYSDAKIVLDWAIRDRWLRNIEAVDIDAILRRVAQEALINTEEAEFLAVAWVTSAWTSSYASGAVAKWSNQGSDPRAQVNTARRLVQRQCGRKPNSMILPAAVADALLVHPKVIYAIRGGHGGTANQDIGYDDLKGYFKVEKLTVAERIQNNGASLDESAIDLNFSVSDGALLFVDDGAGPTTASALIRAGYRGVGDNDMGVMVDQGTNLEDRYDWWNIGRHAGFNVLDPRAGIFWEDLV